MKKVIIGFIATALVATAAVFGYSKATATDDDCCKEGAACCKPGAACCVKK